MGGLPDDSREEDEREEERRLRDLRGRVKAARAVVASTPGLTDLLRSDWRKAARFHGRFGVTEVLLHHGVPHRADSPDKDPLGRGRWNLPRVPMLQGEVNGT